MAANFSNIPITQSTAHSPRPSLGPEELTRRYCEALSKWPNLCSLFQSRMAYFKDPEAALIAEARLRQIPSHLASDSTEKLLTMDTERARTKSLVNDVVFLTIVRGNLKELLLQNAPNTVARFAEYNIQGDRLLNLRDPILVKNMFESALQQRLISNSQHLSHELLINTGHSLEDFAHNPQLFTIFADEVAQALVHSLARSSQRRGNDQTEKSSSTGNLLKSLAPMVHGNLTVELLSKDLSCLRGGRLSGDCTAPGSLNYWATGGWALTLENFELHFSHHGEFFCRLVGTAGFRADKGRSGSDKVSPALYYHGIEFTPLTRSIGSTSRFMDEKLQQSLFADVISYLPVFAQERNFEASFMTKISNSFGFGQILDKLIHDPLIASRVSWGSYHFRLPSPLESAHRILTRLFPSEDDRHRTVATYLQGWRSRTLFSVNTPVSVKDALESLNDGAPRIAGVSRATMEEVSRLFMATGNAAIEEQMRVIQQLSKDSYRELLREAILSKDPDISVQRKLRSVTATVSVVMNQVDPGSTKPLLDQLAKAQRDAVRKVVDTRLQLLLLPLDQSQPKVIAAKSLVEDVITDVLLARKNKTIRSIEELDSFVRASVLKNQDRFSALSQPYRAESGNFSQFESDDPYADILDSLELPDEEFEPSTTSFNIADCILAAIKEHRLASSFFSSGRIGTKQKEMVTLGSIKNYFVGLNSRIDTRDVDIMTALKKMLDTETDPASRKLISRPSAWTQTYDHFIHFFSNSLFSQGIDAQSYCTLLETITPELKSKFGCDLELASRTGGSVQKDEIPLILNDLSIIVEFYKFASNQSYNQRQPCLTSEVVVYSVQQR